jgi:hypothetical protein
LSYFTTIIEEVVTQSNTSDTYRAYIRRETAVLEREWILHNASSGRAGG